MPTMQLMKKAMQEEHDRAAAVRSFLGQYNANIADVRMMSAKQAVAIVVNPELVRSQLKHAKFTEYPLNGKFGESVMEYRHPTIAGRVVITTKATSEEGTFFLDGE